MNDRDVEMIKTMLELLERIENLKKEMKEDATPKDCVEDKDMVIRILEVKGCDKKKAVIRLKYSPKENAFNFEIMHESMHGIGVPLTVEDVGALAHIFLDGVKGAKK